jgi:hypothetical protein
MNLKKITKDKKCSLWAFLEKKVGKKKRYKKCKKLKK